MAGSLLFYLEIGRKITQNDESREYFITRLQEWQF